MLSRDEFASVRSRDEFFDRMRLMPEREAAEVRNRVDKSCAGADCDRQLAAADAGRAEEPATIEQRRTSAKPAGRD